MDSFPETQGAVRAADGAKLRFLWDTVEGCRDPRLAHALLSRVWESEQPLFPAEEMGEGRAARATSWREETQERGDEPHRTLLEMAVFSCFNNQQRHTQHCLGQPEMEPGGVGGGGSLVPGKPASCWAWCEGSEGRHNTLLLLVLISNCGLLVWL